MRITEAELKGVHGIEGYTSHSLKNYVFEYPSNWVLGRGYLAKSLHAQIKGPSFVWILISCHNKGKYPDPKSFSEFFLGIIAKDSTRSDLKVVSTKNLEFRGYSALEIEYTFNELKHIPEGSEKARRCRHLIFDHGDVLYDLEYTAPESTCSKYLEAYDRLKSSFKFVE